MILSVEDWKDFGESAESQKEHQGTLKETTLYGGDAGFSSRGASDDQRQSPAQGQWVGMGFIAREEAPVRPREGGLTRGLAEPLCKSAPFHS